MSRFYTISYSLNLLIDEKNISTSYLLSLISFEVPQRRFRSFLPFFTSTLYILLDTTKYLSNEPPIRHFMTINANADPQFIF